MSSLPGYEQNLIEGTNTASPGRQLQAAREALGLTPAAMAERLHLNAHVIEAIEADEYSQLAPGYARGYIRSYARILGLEWEPIVAAYNKLTATEAPPLQPFAAAQSTHQISSQDGPVRLFSYLVAIAVIGLVFMWWYNREYSQNAGDTPWSVNTAEEKLGPQPDQQITLPETTREPSSPETSSTQSVAPVPGSNPVPAQTINPLPGTAPPVSTPVAPQQQANPPTVPGTTSQQPAFAAGTGATPPSLATSSAAQRLVLEFSGDSWTEVKDAKGSRLLYKMGKVGETVAVEGMAPFSVKVGNTNSVNLMYNGKRIDMAPFSRGGVARFKLNQEGASL